VAALERDGLLRRSAHPTDRRSVVVRLTAKGRRRVEAAVPLHHRNIEAGMSELTLDERAQLATLLLKLAAGFDDRP
jgi:DNA-binding MarR family transcriptional regulator